MAKSMICVVNTGSQSVTAGGTVSLGSVIRRFGCNLALSGNGIEARGQGYYRILANLTVEPAAVGNITATFYKDGVAVPGATATAYAATVDNPVVIPVLGMIRLGCCGDEVGTLTCVLSAEGVVTNIITEIEKI